MACTLHTTRRAARHVTDTVRQTHSLRWLCMLTGLNHLTLAVCNLQRSVQFYRDVLASRATHNGIRGHISASEISGSACRWTPPATARPLRRATTPITLLGLSSSTLRTSSCTLKNMAWSPGKTTAAKAIRFTFSALMATSWKSTWVLWLRALPNAKLPRMQACALGMRRPAAQVRHL